MNEKQIEEIVEEVCKLVLKRIKNDGYFKNVLKRKNATVVSVLSEGESNVGKKINVSLPYDSTVFSVPNETGKDLNKGDLVCIEYCIDLKNAIAVYKVN